MLKNINLYFLVLDCAPGLWSNHCSKNCSLHCGDVCNRVSGNCNCYSGYIGKRCDQTMPDFQDKISLIIDDSLFIREKKIVLKWMDNTEINNAELTVSYFAQYGYNTANISSINWNKTTTTFKKELILYNIQTLKRYLIRIYPKVNYDLLTYYGIPSKSKVLKSTCARPANPEIPHLSNISHFNNNNLIATFTAKVITYEILLNN